MSDNDPKSGGDAPQRSIDSGLVWADAGPAVPRGDQLTRDSLREVEAILGRRIDALERENAGLRQKMRLGLIGLGGLFMITTVLAVLSAPRGLGVAESLQANQFVLRDQSGLIRGIWEMERDAGPRLVLRDGDGRERVRLSTLRDGSPGVTLGDRDGRPRVVLGLLPDGSTNLVFADGAGVTRAVLGHSSTEATTLVLADRDGYTRAGLVVDPDGDGSLTLYETAAPFVPVEPEVVVDP
jgi:hypothetical protein